MGAGVEFVIPSAARDLALLRNGPSSLATLGMPPD